jgi:NAD(P)H-dependent FMN reductase
MLLVSGSLRRASTNTALLRTVQAETQDEIECLLYQDLALVPPFNPDDDVEPVHSAVARVRDLVHRSDAILFCTPEYAGALPGVLKNLLEWLIGDGEPGSIDEKPVAWINASPRGARQAHVSLRTVLEYAHAEVVDQACADVPVARTAIGADGLLSDPSARQEVRHAARVLCDHASDANCLP